MESIYYDGTKLLSLTDIDGEKPVFYICDGNRSAGKTTFFNRMLMNNYYKDGSEFILLFRNAYELHNSETNFMTSIKELFFPDLQMKAFKVSQGLFVRIEVGEYIAVQKGSIVREQWIGQTCGYAVALSTCDKLKRYSNTFYKVSNIYFDEFMSETNQYLSDEVKKLQSFLISVSRGGGKQYRYTRCIMTSNSIDMINPYYLQLGITKRLRKDTKFIRGNGWVFEHTLNENASKSIIDSPLGKAFKGSNYMEYATTNKYFNNEAFISQPKGQFFRLATFLLNGSFYSLRRYENVFYFTKAKDIDTVFAFDLSEHHEGTTLITRTEFMPRARMVSLFARGMVYFKDLETKNAYLTIIELIDNIKN